MFNKSIQKGIALAAALFVAAPAVAADWTPEAPIELQIGFGAGGETDTMGRVVAKAIEEATGWDMVVVNKPGGGGIAMLSGLVAQDANGLKLGMTVNIPTLINLNQRGDTLPFDLDSFDYIGTVAKADLGLFALADAGFSDIASLVEFARENNGAKIAWDGPALKKMMEVIAAENDVKFRMVKAESSAEMVKLVLGGQVDAAFGSGAHLSYLEAGKIQMIFAASAERLDYAKDTPTAREQGYESLVFEPYFFIAAPTGLPEDAHKALQAALDNAVKDPQVIDVVENTMQAPIRNLGGDGTKQMLVDSKGPIALLFSE